MTSPSPTRLPAAALSRDEGAEFLLPLPGSPRLLAGTRRDTRIALAGWRLPQEIAEDALLVVSELISNAVLHALPPAALKVARRRTATGGVLGVEVTDGGPAAVRSACVPASPDEHGRGLTIVRALSTDHGTRTEQDGSVTWWAELSAPWGE
ncbi:hypothetical protein C0Q64_28765 [Streptomyces albidoflavus]|uniref:ATP-binding protein n=1 Tax=Streptomyces albidoflavus TaxID=1886 RepID=UPI00101E658D|nr:ATP-binding protein [Streptomyces albidoflavus]RZD89981.1 hypothetical protein C0Q64_28765 [Streptomyces albidoflavus]RZD93567.1 hypothetical protein C0Q65_28930 [Streptomyces albidoflavus]